MKTERIDYKKVDGSCGYYFIHNAGKNTACLVMPDAHDSPGSELMAQYQPWIEKYDLSVIFSDPAENDRVFSRNLHEMLADCQAKYHFSRYIFADDPANGVSPGKFLEKAAGLRDFETVYQRENESIFPTAPNSLRKGYNIFCYYTGKYFEAHPADETPECIVHARAIDYALARLPLDFPEDQLFFGGVENFFSLNCPAHLSEAEYQKYYDIAVKRGMRYFRIGWDHAAPDYHCLMEKGLGDFIRRASAAQKVAASAEREAMLIALLAVVKFFRRVGGFWQEKRPEAAARLLKVAENPPETFAEGLQLMWLIHVILEAQLRFHMALARMDQYLFPLYQRDTIDQSTALNMLCHIFSKVEGFHEVTNICIGGVKPDGSEAVNDLSFLILKAVAKVRSASTNLSARVHKNSPVEFLKACGRLISSGIGFPAIMNDEVYIPSMMKCGIPLEAARDYALFGCVEGNIPGRAPAWSDERFDVSGRFCQVMMELEKFATFEELRSALSEAVKDEFHKCLAVYNKSLADHPAASFPDPLLSALTRDCIDRGRDINDGGAEFPRQHGMGVIGPATVANSLAAVKKLVFEEKRIGKSELVEALKNNFAGKEVLRQTLINCAPKYGNDEPFVDEIFADLVRLCGESVMAMRTIDGGFLRSCMASNISNIPMGKLTGATPDGRLAGTPLSDAASPDGGLDKNGPTAFVNSITSPDYTAQNCTVVNMRFQPEMFENEDGLSHFTVLLQRFIAGGGHEIQFNVTNNEVLLDAVAHPEKYGDLIVRVSGFSAFFTQLSPAVQQDIIRRTIHGR